MALKYRWLAIENDDTELEQDAGGSENPYSDVITLINADNVKEFRIVEQNEGTPNLYSVDTVNYKFYKGTVATPHNEDITPGGISGTGRATIIFKRRNQIRVDEFGNIVDPARTTFIIGFKIDGTSYTMDVRAKVGQLPEEVVNPRETTEEPIL